MEKPHSAEYFGKQRDFWWNRDFVELMAKRIGFESISSVLDVGCGIGHWGQILSDFFPENTVITGVDREPIWIEKAKERVNGIPRTFQYQVATAEQLPFPDNSFDMVTCQTLLIHVKDVQQVVKEMLRVLKPNGKIFVCEPNNLVHHAIFNSVNFNAPDSEIVDTFAFMLACERGKKNLGLGFNSIGDMLPKYLIEAGIKNIRIYSSDKIYSLLPPYNTEEEKAVIEQLKEWQKKELVVWDKEETKKYYVAGGGEENSFEKQWSFFIKRQDEIIGSINNNMYYGLDTGIGYLIFGEK